MDKGETRWLTGIGTGLCTAAIGFALIAPAPWLGVPLLFGAYLLAWGIAKGL